MPKAKKDKKNEEITPETDSKGKAENGGEEDEEKGGGVIIFFVAFLILLVWLAIIALLIHMDVGGIGSTILYPYLKNVPVVNKVLPESELAEQVENDPYAFSSMNEAVGRVKQLEKQIAAEKKKRQKAEEQMADSAQIRKELKKYKKNEAAFEKLKAKFYEEVVYSDNAPEIEQYKAFYESIEPQTAERLYKQVIADIQQDEELKDYVATYSSMKPAEAAKIFDTMTKNLKLVAKILKGMDKESRGKILGKMDADTAAAVTKLMNPD
ncbi:MAG: hypothetical protein K5889_03540 [Lachnospiraceae bacterium]|nr:hypothetical protein [Lachnospiraceae bacterium]